MASYLDSLPLDLRKLLLHYFWFSDLENVCKVPQFAVLDADDNFWKEMYSSHLRPYNSTKDLCFRTWKQVEEKAERSWDKICQSGGYIELYDSLIRTTLNAATIMRFHTLLMKVVS